MPLIRVVAYVDGFNLYFGLKAKHGRKYLWLDLQALAESLLRPDQALDRYDTALLISADSDLCPAIRAMKRLRPEKRVVAAFPPRRQSGDLRRAVDGYLAIGDDKIRHSQLPRAVVAAGGITLHRPKHWT